MIRRRLSAASTAKKYPDNTVCFWSEHDEDYVYSYYCCLVGDLTIGSAYIKFRQYAVRSPLTDQFYTIQLKASDKGMIIHICDDDPDYYEGCGEDTWSKGLNIIHEKPKL